MKPACCFHIYLLTVVGRAIGFHNIYIFVFTICAIQDVAVAQVRIVQASSEMSVLNSDSGAPDMRLSSTQRAEAVSTTGAYIRDRKDATSTVILTNYSDRTIYIATSIKQSHFATCTLLGVGPMISRAAIQVNGSIVYISGYGTSIPATFAPGCGQMTVDRQSQLLSIPAHTERSLGFTRLAEVIVGGDPGSASISQAVDFVASVLPTTDLSVSGLQQLASGAVEFSIVNSGAATSRACDFTAFWSTGPNRGDIIKDSIVFSQQIASGLEGGSAKFTVADTVVRNRPSNATHLWVLVDEADVVREENEANNWELVQLRKCDLVASKLRWNIEKRGLDGVYSIEWARSSTPSIARLYWASQPPGIPVLMRMSEIPGCEVQIPADRIGTNFIAHFEGDLLTNAPSGATALAFYIDADYSVPEFNEFNNETSIPDVVICFRPDANPNSVSENTYSALKDIYRKAALPSGQITSTSRTEKEQAEIMFKQLAYEKFGEISKYGLVGSNVIETYRSETNGLTLDQVRAKEPIIIAAMLLSIERQRPARVSKHVADYRLINAIDVSISMISTEKSRLDFIRAACAQPGMTTLLAPTAYRRQSNCVGTHDGTFHLEFPQTQSVFVPVRNPVLCAPRRSKVGLQSSEVIDYGLLDLESGFASATGFVSDGRAEYRFEAGAGDVLNVTIFPAQLRTQSWRIDEDSMMYLLDEAGRIVAQNDDSEDRGLNASLSDMLISQPGVYRLVITTFPARPIVGPDGIVSAWLGNGEGSLDFDIEISVLPLHPRLDIETRFGTNAVVKWVGPGTLQLNTRAGAGWIDLTNAYSPYVINPADSPSFFRLGD